MIRYELLRFGMPLQIVGAFDSILSVQWIGPLRKSIRLAVCGVLFEPRSGDLTTWQISLVKEGDEIAEDCEGVFPIGNDYFVRVDPVKTNG